MTREDDDNAPSMGDQSLVRLRRYRALRIEHELRRQWPRQQVSLAAPVQVTKVLSDETLIKFSAPLRLS